MPAAREIDVQQWFGHVGRQPDAVDREWFVAGPTEPIDQHQRRVGTQPELVGGLRVGHETEVADFAVLRDAALLDDLEEAVERSERPFERSAVDGRADAACPPEDPVGAELAHRVAGGVATDVVHLHEFAIGREPVRELTEFHAPTQFGIELGPQWRAGPAIELVRALGEF